MSNEKEVGVFTTGLALFPEGLVRYERAPEYTLSPVIHELINKSLGCIDSEGLYKFTLTVTKIK